MSKTHRHTDKYNPKPQHRRSGRPRGTRAISVRSIQRDQPDLHKLSRAVIALALAEAEAEGDATRADVTDNDTTERSDD